MYINNSIPQYSFGMYSAKIVKKSLQQKAKKLKFGKSHLSNWKKGGVCHHLLLHLPLAPIPLNYGPGVKHVKKNWLNNFF